MWLKAILLALLALIVVVAVWIFRGGNRWRAATRLLHARMESARVPCEVDTYDPQELARLPAPVQRYLRAVLREGQPLVQAVTVEHAGTFNMSDSEENWRPFTSTQRVTTRRPGFAWDARIRMMPGMTVFVHDAYVAGEGVLRAKVFGLLTVMEQRPTPELAHGELMRFLAESAWYPTALLPCQGVLWEGINETEAAATLADGTTTVRLVFRFDGEGLISSVHSDGRARLAKGTQAATPWQGRFWGYERRDGMLVPREGEVAWLLPEGPKPYWRGRIQRIEYEYAIPSSAITRGPGPSVAPRSGRHPYGRPTHADGGGVSSHRHRRGLLGNQRSRAGTGENGSWEPSATIPDTKRGSVDA